MSRHRPGNRRAGPSVVLCPSTGKPRYPDEAMALATLASMQFQAKRGQRKDKTDSLVPFRCGACAGWHLGRRR